MLICTDGRDGPDCFPASTCSGTYEATSPEYLYYIKCMLVAAEIYGFPP